MDNSQPPLPEQGLQLNQVSAILGKWRWLIIVLTGASVLTAAFLAEFVLPKVYQATVTLDVSYAAPPQGQGTVPSQSQTLQGVIQSVATLPQNTLQTYQWQATNPVVLQATSKTLATKGVHLTADQLGRMVTATTVTNTNLISVSVQNTDPSLATTVANTLAAAYLQTIQAQDHEKLAQAVGFLQTQAASIQTQLQKATQALATATLNSADSPTESAQLSADNTQLGNLQAQLTQAQITEKADQAGLQAAQSQLAKTPPTIQKQETVPSGQASASGAAAGGTTSRTVTTTEPNPAYTQLQQEVGADQVTLAKDQATVQALDAAISAVTAAVGRLSAATVGSQAQIQSLQSQVDELTSTYKTLMQNLTQAQVSDSVSLGTTIVTVASPAVTPTVPIKPKKKVDVALALVLGLVVSVGLAFLLEHLDTTLRNPAHVERLTQGPVLAVIPHFGE